jgi:catechol 2,3-dioxygenase-like lactoylglutathione lyase family enzyme
MEMNGIAHIQITVNDYPACRAFYRQLFSKLEMFPVLDTEEMIYGIGSRTGVLVMPSAPEFRGERFEQRRIGLHHFCFRARSREDIDELHAYLVDIGAKVVHPPEEGPWAPGYYSVLFEDPDGIRIEANFVPGKGLRQP